MNRSGVVDAGVGLARRGALGALGMRAVAGELGVTPMALYRHIGDAAALHEAVMVRLLDELPGVSETGPWDERCRRWARQLRTVTSDCPGSARYLLMHWTELRSAVVMVNDLATMLEADGPKGLDATAASNAAFTHVLACVQAEEAVRAQGLLRELSSWAAMGASAPFLNAHRAEYAVARVDEHVDYGLEALLAGFATARRGERRARP